MRYMSFSVYLPSVFVKRCNNGYINAYKPFVGKIAADVEQRICYLDLF